MLFVFKSVKYCYKKLVLHNLDIRTIETENDIAASSKVVFIPFEMPEACFYDLTKDVTDHPFDAEDIVTWKKLKSRHFSQFSSSL